jgi:hypothetical protein
MAPTPIVRNTILDVLTSAERPLSFSEVQQRTAVALGRKRVDGKTISEALTFLRKARSVEKEIVEGKAVWSLTSRYYISSLQSSFQKLITKGVFNDIGKILDNAMTNMTIPHTVFLILLKMRTRWPIRLGCLYLSPGPRPGAESLPHSSMITFASKTLSGREWRV